MTNTSKPSNNTSSSSSARRGRGRRSGSRSPSPAPAVEQVSPAESLFKTVLNVLTTPAIVSDSPMSRLAVQADHRLKRDGSSGYAQLRLGDRGTFIRPSGVGNDAASLSGFYTAVNQLMQANETTKPYKVCNHPNKDSLSPVLCVVGLTEAVLKERITTRKTRGLSRSPSPSPRAEDATPVASSSSSASHMTPRVTPTAPVRGRDGQRRGGRRPSRSPSPLPELSLKIQALRDLRDGARADLEVLQQELQSLGPALQAIAARMPVCHLPPDHPSHYRGSQCMMCSQVTENVNANNTRILADIAQRQQNIAGCTEKIDQLSRDLFNSC